MKYTVAASKQKATFTELKLSPPHPFLLLSSDRHSKQLTPSLMSPVMPPPQKYSGLLQFRVVVPSCKSRSPARSSLSSLFPFLLCKNLFLPCHINTSNSSTRDAGNQALLPPNPAWQPAHPDLLLPTGLREEEELGSSFSIGKECSDGAKIPELRKNAWHTSEIMKCLAAHAFAALEGALVPLSRLIWWCGQAAREVNPADSINAQVTPTALLERT